MVDQGRSGVTFPLLVFLTLLLSLNPSFEQLEVLSSRGERAALLALRSSLGLRSRDWPRKADPCLVWTGVSCKNGSVIGINISGFRRTRVGSQDPKFAVEALANLTKLSSFNASRFLLPGPIPDWLGLVVTSLEVLDLRFCSVQNAIPGSMGNLTNLSGLYLSGNTLTSMIPSSLGQLARLSVLDLSGNNLTGSIPDSFGSLGNLTSLDVSSNVLSGPIPPALGTLSKLVYLNLSRNNLGSTMPAQFGNLSKLVDLDLSFNLLSGSLPADLQGLKSLARMLIGNNVLSGSLTASVFPVPSQMQDVDLSHNAFTGIVPIFLWSTPRLRSLDISRNNFTGVLPDTFDANATKALLNLSTNLFFGNLSSVLRRFSSVDLSGNYFEGGVPSYVGPNASLSSNCLQNESDQRTLTDCSSFYAERGLTFDNFGQQPNSTQKQGSGKNHRKVIIYASVFGGVGLALCLVLLVLLLFCIRKRGTTSQRGVGVGPALPEPSPPPPGVAPVNFSNLGDKFTNQQLFQATGDFGDGNLIKHGHSGDLFRGILENGFPIVVKRVDLRRVKQEFHLMELDFFSKVSHTRFVPFLGHCLGDENEKFLVYRMMPNADLSSALYRKGSSDDDSLQSLDWITRLKIAIGAAEGLCHLHHECTPPIVHRDIQASSILLDDKFEVRLGSLSEACAHEGDSQQSRITRFLRLPQSSEQGTSSGLVPATCAFDVFCFGKVLLELVTGKLGISSSSDAQLREWLEQLIPCIDMYDKELVTKIVDPSLIIDEDLLEEVWAMAIVARSCLNPKPSRRPPMRYVLKALENPLKVVREENTGSARLRTTSSRSSWNAALFGSWRQSSSEVAVIPAGSGAKMEGPSSFKRSGTSNSQGSGPNGGDHSSSHRRHSNEICPEPSDELDFERQDHD